MAATTTIGLTGLGALAFAGSGALAAAGAAGLALLGRGGGGGGRRRGGRGRGRHGRSITPQEETNQVNQFLEEIKANDLSGCGRKLVCELAAKDPLDLNEEEAGILEAVGPAVVPGQGILPPEAVWDYREARGHGVLGESCTNLYNRCHMDASSIMVQANALIQ